MPDTRQDLIDQADRLEAEIRAGKAGTKATAVLERIDRLIAALHRYQVEHPAQDRPGYLQIGRSDKSGPNADTLFALAWLHDYLTRNGLPATLPGPTVKSILHSLQHPGRSERPQQTTATADDQATLRRIIGDIQKRIEQGSQPPLPPEPEVPQLDLSLEPADAVPGAPSMGAVPISHGEFDRPWPPPAEPAIQPPPTSPAGAPTTSRPVRDDTLKGSFSDLEPLTTDVQPIDYRETRTDELGRARRPFGRGLPEGALPPRGVAGPAVPSGPVAEPRQETPSDAGWAAGDGRATRDILSEPGAMRRPRPHSMVPMVSIIVVVIIAVGAVLRFTILGGGPAPSSASAIVTSPSAPASVGVSPSPSSSGSAPHAAVASAEPSMGASEVVPSSAPAAITDNKLIYTVGNPCIGPTTLHAGWIVTGAAPGARVVVDMHGPGLPAHATFAVGADGSFAKDYTIPAGSGSWTTEVFSIGGAPAPASNAKNKATATCG